MPLPNEWRAEVNAQPDFLNYLPLDVTATDEPNGDPEKLVVEFANGLIEL